MRQPFVLLFATFALAGTTGRSEPTASFGTVYEPRQTKIEIVIKRSAFDQLPLDLPVYTTQDTNAFTRISIDWLLELLPLPGPERARAMQILSDHPSVVSKGRTMLSSAPNVTCVINPDESLFLCRYQNPGPAPTTATKPGNGLLGLEVFRLMLTNLFAKAEWKIGDVERRENDFRMQIADRQRYPNHQKEPVTVERTVTFFRHINDYPIIAATTFEIRLSRLANGDWSEVFIHWPQIKELGREKISFRSAALVKEALLERKGVWDRGNEIGPTNTATLRVSNIRIAYVHSPEEKTVKPVIVLQAETSANGQTSDVVIYLPCGGR